MTTNLRINPTTALLKPIKYQASPHQDERPIGMPIDMVVVHGISLPPGEFGGDTIEAFFCGHLDMSSHPAFAAIATLKVSAHLLIKRSGEIIQFVPFKQRAWHAGESHFHGRTRCNDFSIGIELEGTDDLPYERIQYQVLADVVRLLMQCYPNITSDRIVGHMDIAPGRKTDPGLLFDWEHFRQLISGSLR